MQELKETPFIKPSRQDQMYTRTLTFPVQSLLEATYHRYYLRSPPLASSVQGWGLLPSLWSRRCKYFIKL